MAKNGCIENNQKIITKNNYFILNGKWPQMGVSKITKKLTQHVTILSEMESGQKSPTPHATRILCAPVCHEKYMSRILRSRVVNVTNSTSHA